MKFLYFFVVLFAVINADHKDNDNTFESNEILSRYLSRYKAKTTVPTVPTTRKKSNFDKKNGIQSSDYMKVSQTMYYVDKTQYIRRVMESDNKNMEFCAPKRFSKSTFLSMLDNFLSLEIDQNGKKSVEQLESATFNSFRNKAVFNNEQGIPLSDEEIKKDDLFRLHFQNHPVIHADFSRVSGRTYHFLLHSVHTQIVKACKRHEYIFKNDTLWSNTKAANEKEIFMENYCMLRRENEVKSISECSITEAFSDLSEKLYRHFGKKVVVLIDEVDAPTTSALYGELFSELDIKGIDQIMKSLLTTICKEIGSAKYLYIENVIVTSILGLSATSSQEPTNLKRYRFLHNEEYEFLFGFTQHEVEEIIKKNVEYLNTKIKNYKEEYFITKTALWYDGYESRSDVSIYNPWSVVNLITDGIFSRYWAPSLNQENFIYLCIHPKIFATIWRLLNHESVEMKIMGNSIDYINTPTLLTLREILLKIKVSDPSPFFKYLCEYGFLSCEIVDDDKMIMKIPNYEIHLFMENRIFAYEPASTFYDISADLTTSIGESFLVLINNKSDHTVQQLASNLGLLHRTMHSALQKVTKGINEACNIHFVEHNFKWILYVILNHYFPAIKDGNTQQRVFKEKSVSGGRIDVVLTTRGFTFIMELKYGGNSKTAINQCLENNYRSFVSEYLNTDDGKYMLLGINFRKDEGHTVQISYLLDQTDEKSIQTVSSEYPM